MMANGRTIEQMADALGLGDGDRKALADALEVMRLRDEARAITGRDPESKARRRELILRMIALAEGRDPLP
jgi:hypothetical protein